MGGRFGLKSEWPRADVRKVLLHHRRKEYWRSTPQRAQVILAILNKSATTLTGRASHMTPKLQDRLGRCIRLVARLAC